MDKKSVFHEPVISLNYKIQEQTGLNTALIPEFLPEFRFYIATELAPISDAIVGHDFLKDLNK